MGTDRSLNRGTRDSTRRYTRARVRGVQTRAGGSRETSMREKRFTSVVGKTFGRHRKTGRSYVSRDAIIAIRDRSE